MTSPFTLLPRGALPLLMAGQPGRSITPRSVRALIRQPFQGTAREPQDRRGFLNSPGIRCRWSVNLCGPSPARPQGFISPRFHALQKPTRGLFVRFFQALLSLFAHGAEHHQKDTQNHGNFTQQCRKPEANV